MFIIRPDDTFDILKEKVRKATIYGTLQSAMTDLHYLSDTWKKNLEEERLLGVCLAGIMDHPVMSNSGKFDWVHRWKEWIVGNGELDIERVGWTGLESVLEELKQIAIDTNIEWAKKLGINPSVAITSIKPTGNSGELFNTSSGIHPRYSKYYNRAVRFNKDEPLTKFLVDQGLYYEQDITNPSTYVFYFPRKAPEGSITRNEVTAIDQLELYKVYTNYWAEHTISITVYVEKDEWLKVGAWVYDNWDSVTGGISFMPKSDFVYKQAPYQEISEEEYEKYRLTDIEINWDLLTAYEKEDYTTVASELSCQGGVCEI